MATALRTTMAPERYFYSGMAVFMALVVFAGFAPSFYLRGIVHSPRPNPTLPPLVMVHGLMFTLWVLTFWVQTTMVAMGRRDLHIKLGSASFGLALLLVPVTYAVAVGQVARASQPPFATPLGWTAVPLFLLLPFVILVWLGWRNRRQAAAHKRLMLGATLLMMNPAIGRLPIVPPVLAGFAALNVLSLATFTPLVWWDLKTLGRIHWATKLGVGLFAASMLLALVAIGSPAWERVAARLPGV